MKRDVRVYLDDILEAISKIERYANQAEFAGFAGDEQRIDAVIRNFEVIGEAARQIPDSMQESHPEVPWEDMIGMRNKLIHEYFGVNAVVVWKTIQEDLPKLKSQVAALSAELERGSG